MLQGLLFDLGSTLLTTDHQQHWPVMLNRMRWELLARLQAAGYALDPAEFLARFAAKVSEFERQRQTDWVEYTNTWILTSTLAELNAPPPAPEVVAGALAAYHRDSESRWRPVPGVAALLAQLRAAGLRLGLVTNSPDEGHARRLIDAAGLRPFFDPIVISAAVGVRKPNPRIFALALQPWGLPPDQCAMVGDMLGADILGAQLAGLHTIWVSARADHPANQAHRGNILPDREIETVLDLPSVLGLSVGDERRRTNDERDN